MIRNRRFAARIGLVSLAVFAILGPVSPAPVAVAQPAPPASEHAWPTSPSPEPKDGAWDSAAELETVRVELPNRWWGGDVSVQCTQRALGEWVRITCTPPHDGTNDVLLGVVWGLAGDLSSVKGQFELSAKLPRYAKPPENIVEYLSRKMGASATITFQVQPGSAFVLSLDEIGWDETYDGSNVFSRAGILVDVSWAHGENAPTILFR